MQRIIITTDGQVITDEALETAKDIQKCLALRKKYLYQAKVPSAIRAFFSLSDAVPTGSHLRWLQTPWPYSLDSAFGIPPPTEIPSASEVHRIPLARLVYLPPSTSHSPLSLRSTTAHICDA